MPTETLERPDSLEDDFQQPVAEAISVVNPESEQNPAARIAAETEPEINLPEKRQSIENFEQTFGPLPEEIKQQVQDFKQEKLDRLKEQIGGLTRLREQLEADPCVSWISEGKIVAPSLVEAAIPGFQQVLNQKLEAFLQTPEGQSAQKDRQLESFAANPNPTKYEVAEAAKLLGMVTNEVKLKVFPGHYKKVAVEIKAKIGEHFRGYDDGLEDVFGGLHDKASDEEKASERERVKNELMRLILPASKSFAEKINQSRLFSIYAREQDLAGLPNILADLDQAKTISIQEIVHAAEMDPLLKTLDTIARGHLKIEEAVALLREAEGPQVNNGLYEIFNSFKAKSKAKLWESLPEPSLVGLDIEKADIDLVEQGFDRLLEIASLLGQKPDDKGADMEIVQKEIRKSQDQFFAGIGSEFDMYWHFSPFGRQIFESRQLSPSQATGNLMTGTHSRSIHFIKPGLTGMHSMVDYTGYAQTGVRLGSMGPNYEKKIADAFGVAVIYPLGKLAETLPYRDEPEKADRTSADTVFREGEDQNIKSLPLEDAYILPMLSDEQIRTLSDSADFKDLFSSAWQPREELSLAVTKRAAEIAGFSQEWIEKHVLTPVPLGRTTTLSAKDVYAPVSQQLRARLPASRRIVVPLSANPGAFETHDINGGETKSGGWHEKLIILKTE